MTLDEIRKEIDQIDPQIKELFLRRMEVAKKVAETKFATSDAIYKRERETEIIQRLTENVVPELKMEYTSVIKKIMEVARKYEYGLIVDWNPEVVDNCLERKSQGGKDELKLQLTQPNDGYGLAFVISVISNYGFRIKEVQTVEEENDLIDILCTIYADFESKETKKLIYQLSQESIELKVL